MFTPDDLDAHDIEEIICEVAGCEPDGWNYDTIGRVIFAGANLMLRQRDAEVGYGMKYWLDDKGRLWHGPTSFADNLHYGTFGGFNNVDRAPIWVSSRSSEPEGREISRDEALAIMQGWSHADVA